MVTSRKPPGTGTPEPSLTPPASKTSTKPLADTGNAKLNNKPLVGPEPRSQNTLGKIIEQPNAMGDVDILLSYLEQSLTREQAIEDYRLASDMEQEALAVGDKRRASQIRDYIAGLKDKLVDFGVSPKDLPARPPMSPEQQAQLFETAMDLALSRARGEPGAQAAITTARIAGKQKILQGRGGVRIDGPPPGPRPCVVGTYSEIRGKCGPGGQAHHIVPDSLNRTGNRRQGTQGLGRIPGMPSLNDGPAICLQGQAKSNGSEHNTAHQCDEIICAAGLRADNGPPGTLPVFEAVEIAMDAAIAARPDCADAIGQQVEKSYPNYKKDNRSMNAAGKPSTGDAKSHLEQGGNATPAKKPGKRR